MTLPPSSFSGSPTPPLNNHSALYYAAVESRILRPFAQSMFRRITLAETSYVSIRNAINTARANVNLPGVAGQIARQNLGRIEASHKRRFARSMGRLLGVSFNPFTGDPAVTRYMEDAVRDNVDLIVSIPGRFQAQLTQDVLDIESVTPFDQFEMTKLFRDTYGKQRYPLRRLTRDQNNKLVGALSRIRQTSAGIDEYQWSTSQDERVRDTHVANNGLIFQWDTPPPNTSHPGHEIMCRCVALPVISGTRLTAEGRRRGSRIRPPPLPSLIAT